MISLDSALKQCPLIAILRGVAPDEIDAISDALIEEGLRIIEVPLNSPDPLRTIELLAGRHGQTAIIGAGTVMTPDDVIDIRDAGGELIVMPHTDAEVQGVADVGRHGRPKHGEHHDPIETGGCRAGGRSRRRVALDSDPRFQTYGKPHHRQRHGARRHQQRRQLSAAAQGRPRLHPRVRCQIRPSSSGS